jgi:hypothetical protein
MVQYPVAGFFVSVEQPLLCDLVGGARGMIREPGTQATDQYQTRAQ